MLQKRLLASTGAALNDIVININGMNKKLAVCKCKDFYWMILGAKYSDPTCKKAWAKQFPILEDLEKKKWANIFKIPFQSTRETCIQSFQYKLINRTIACNRWLFNLTVQITDRCNYCEKSDTILHFFVWCNKCNDFWNLFVKWWNRLSPIQIDNNL